MSPIDRATDDDGVDNDMTWKALKIWDPKEANTNGMRSFHVIIK